MLQKAASNAYSWWWASHIRTKQSKWMEENLQDMEEKVKVALKLIDEDGDTFARRAEMYYKKRPELISFVEETYRAYRALAERYDKISKDLQNAHNTIATVFPEQVQMTMEEEEEETFHKVPKKIPYAVKPNFLKVSTNEFKGVVPSDATKFKTKKTNEATSPKSVKSGLTKPEALQEIDNLQKKILTLQTEKEFVKSSYDSGLARFWEIEEQIRELQSKVCNLQDEFGEGHVIKDGEARHLMAEAAVESCQEKLTQLQEKQDQSTEEAKVEFQRIKEAMEKLKSLKSEFNYDQDNSEKSSPNCEKEMEESKFVVEIKELQKLQENMKEHFDLESNKFLTSSETVQKIDELINKVTSLETAVSSQNALVSRLRTETDELQGQIKTLEDDKANLIEDKNNLNDKLKEMEEKLHRIHELNQTLENQNHHMQTQFTEASCNLDHLRQKVERVKHDEEIEAKATLQKEENSLAAGTMKDGAKSLKDFQVSGPLQNQNETLKEISMEEAKEQEMTNINGSRNAAANAGLPVENENVSSQEQEKAEGDEPNWKQLFLNELQDKKEVLLADHTETPGNYKDVNKRLNEVDGKTEEHHFEISAQLKQLKVANTLKDEEIKLLLEKLSHMQRRIDGLEDLTKSKAVDHVVNSDLLNEQAIETGNSNAAENAAAVPAEDDGLEQILIYQPATTSPMEEKFRMDIDALLEENLDFWLKFRSSFHQIQNIEIEIRDLLGEIEKVLNKKKSEGSGSAKHSPRSDARSLYKHLKEIQTELLVWLEKSTPLKEGLNCRFSSLCHIQEEIIKALKDSAEDDDFKFTSNQSTKFQGEVLNMKQENNKVADELQAGIDHVRSLQTEIEKSLSKLNHEFEIESPKKQQNAQLRHSESRSRAPLRSFIFGDKPKREGHSFFPVYRKHHALKSSSLQ